MQTNRSAGVVPVQQIASARDRRRLSTQRAMVLAVSLSVGGILGVGCGGSTPPPAKPTSSTVDVMQMRQHYQELTPDARVGTVDAVRGEFRWVAISDPQWDKYKEGDGVSVLVGNKQYVTATVEKIQGQIIIAKYDVPTDGLRAPEKGDVAIYIPPEGPGKGKLGTGGASTPAASTGTMDVKPSTPAAPAMPDATATPAPATPAPVTPAAPAAPTTPEVPAAPTTPTPPATPPATPEVPAAPAVPATPAPGAPASPAPETPATPAPAAPAPTTPPEVPATPAAPAPTTPAPETPAPGTTPPPTTPGEGK